METFETIAEIAATLVGFVGIFVAFRFSEFQILKSDFVDFLLSAVGTVLFAFIPTLLMGVIENESTMWRVACGAFGIYHASILVLGAVQHLGERSVAATEYLFALLSLPVIGLKFAVAAGFLLETGYYVYLLGLFWLILNSLFIFCGIVVSSLWGRK